MDYFLQHQGSLKLHNRFQINNLYWTELHIKLKDRQIVADLFFLSVFDRYVHDFDKNFTRLNDEVEEQN